MKIKQIINACNANADKQWDELDADERVEWAIEYIDRKTRSCLEDLEAAVYLPGRSSMSVGHAIDHVRQCLTTIKKEIPCQK